MPAEEAAQPEGAPSEPVRAAEVEPEEAPAEAPAEETAQVEETPSEPVRADAEEPEATPRAEVSQAADLSGQPAAADTAETEDVPAEVPVEEPQPAAVAALKPQALDGPREGTADDLKRISGVGPVLEKKLHELGYFHFDQIAGWTRENVEWVDDHLNFKGRIDRDQWIAQAKKFVEEG